MNSNTTPPGRCLTAGELDLTPDELRALVSSLIASQEDDRRRLARELHDDICQKLAVLEIDAQQIEQQLAQKPEESRNHLARLRTGLGSVSDAVRRISRALYPSVIDDLGMEPALRSLVQRYSERQHMVLALTTQHLPPNIPRRVATGLYWITREALRNISKHAGRTDAQVSLTGSANGLLLQVIDYGRGFDVNARRSGLGLIGMEVRTRMLDGRFRIESEIGTGTRVTVEVPLSDG